MRTAAILLFLALSGPSAGAQDDVGEHLPKRTKPPLPGVCPAGLAPYAARVGGTADPAFDRLVDDAVPVLLALDPVHATELGFHQYDALLPEADSAGMAARRGELARLDARVRASNLRSLDATRQADHARLLASIALARAWGEDPVAYLDVASRGIRSLLPPGLAPDDERASDVIARVNGVAPLLRSGREHLARAALLRADEAIAFSKELVDYLSNTLPVAMKDVRDPVLREELDHHLAQAAGAAADYHDWLVSAKASKASGHPSPGREGDPLAELVRP